MAEKDITFKEVSLNNKSRKGDYVYIKETGKQGKYYKKKPDLQKRDYLEVYNQGGLRSKSGGITAQKIQAIRRVQRKKIGEIDTILRDGYAQNTIERAQTITPFGMKTAYMDLLRNRDKVGDRLGIVRDKELLDIITRPEDVEKWKHRIMYKIELMGNEGLLATANNQTPKTLGIVISDMRELKVVGSNVEGYGRLAKEISNKNYNFEKIADGRITNFRIKMVFRKGR